VHEEENVGHTDVDATKELVWEGASGLDLSSSGFHEQENEASIYIRDRESLQ
jgi:hypothetical protein